MSHARAQIPSTTTPAPVVAPQEAQDEISDAVFEPVLKLDQTVETKTHEEDEEVLFKM